MTIFENLFFFIFFVFFCTSVILIQIQAVRPFEDTFCGNILSDEEDWGVESVDFKKNPPCFSLDILNKHKNGVTPQKGMFTEKNYFRTSFGHFYGICVQFHNIKEWKWVRTLLVYYTRHCALFSTTSSPLSTHYLNDFWGRSTLRSSGQVQTISKPIKPELVLVWNEKYRTLSWIWTWNWFS